MATAHGSRVDDFLGQPKNTPSNMSVSVGVWAPVGPLSLFPVDNPALHSLEKLRWRRRQNFLLAAKTNERIQCVLAAIAFLANEAFWDGISYIEPHTKATMIVPRPAGVPLSRFLNMSRFQDILEPAERVDSGFDIHVRFVTRMISDDKYSCTNDGKRPLNGYCVLLAPATDPSEYKAGQYYTLDVEIPHWSAAKQEHKKSKFYFLALFSFIRTALNEPDANILMTVVGGWYNEIPLRKDVSSFPLSQELLDIASKAVKIAGITDEQESIAYGALTWRVQRQFAGYVGAAARISKNEDEGGFIVGCQFLQLVKQLQNLSSAEPYSRYKFLVVSDVFSAVGRAVGKADSTFGPSDRVVLLMKKALAKKIGDFVLFSEVFANPDLDGLFGIKGLTSLYEQDQRGAPQHRAMEGSRDTEWERDEIEEEDTEEGRGWGVQLSSKLRELI